MKKKIVCLVAVPFTAIFCVVVPILLVVWCTVSLIIDSLQYALQAAGRAKTDFVSIVKCAYTKTVASISRLINKRDM